MTTYLICQSSRSKELYETTLNWVIVVGNLERVILGFMKQYFFWVYLGERVKKMAWFNFGVILFVFDFVLKGLTGLWEWTGFG